MILGVPFLRFFLLSLLSGPLYRAVVVPREMLEILSNLAPRSVA